MKDNNETYARLVSEAANETYAHALMLIQELEAEADHEKQATAAVLQGLLVAATTLALECQATRESSNQAVRSAFEYVTEQGAKHGVSWEGEQ